MGFCPVPRTGLGSGGASATQSDIAEILGQQIIPSWSRRVSRDTEDVGQLHCGAGVLCCLFVKGCALSFQPSSPRSEKQFRGRLAGISSRGRCFPCLLQLLTLKQTTISGFGSIGLMSLSIKGRKHSARKIILDLVLISAHLCQGLVS